MRKGGSEIDENRKARERENTWVYGVAFVCVCVCMCACTLIGRASVCVLPFALTYMSKKENRRVVGGISHLCIK